MRKSFKNICIIIIINIFFFAAFYYLLNKCIDYDFYKKTQKFKNTTENIDIKDYQTEEYSGNELKYNTDLFKQYCGEKRIKFGEQYNSNPIGIIGCSYAYGHGLKKEESFPYLLSEYTKRPVNNYSECGSDANGSLNNLIAKEAENTDKTDYIIYVYMYDHINRYLEKYFLYGNFYNVFNLSDTEKFLCKNSLIRKLFVYYKLHKIIKDYPNTKEAEKYLSVVLKNISENIKRTMPNAEFIIIIYDEKLPLNRKKSAIKFESDIINSKIWEDFAKETGTKVVRTKDITGFYFDKDYKLNEDIAGWHPNAKAWAELTPEFADKYIKD